MSVFTRKELERRGFEYVDYDGTPYLQYVFDKSNYFHSEAILSSDDLGTDMYEVYLGGKMLNSEQLEELTK